MWFIPFVPLCGDSYKPAVYKTEELLAFLIIYHLPNKRCTDISKKLLQIIEAPVGKPEVGRKTLQKHYR